MIQLPAAARREEQTVVLTDRVDRFDPKVKRNILNRSDAPLRALLIGSPADTSYEPMDWA